MPTFAENVLFHAKLNPARPALAFVGGVATYEMLGRGVVTACAFLRRSHLPDAAIAAIDVRNPLHHTALILAGELCGITTVSVHTHFNLARSGLKLDAVLADQFARPLADTRAIPVSDEWFVLAPSLRVDPLPFTEGQFYRIVLSSGATGVPKAVGYTQASARQLLSRQRLLLEEGASASLSMLGFSTIGFLDSLLTLMTGRLACFASTPEETLSMIRVFSVGRLTAMTGQIESLLKSMGDASDPMPSLKFVMTGGSKLSPTLAAEARARLCQNILLSYGSTEAGVVSWGRVGFHDDSIEGAAGYVLPWLELDAFSPEGERLPRGREGLLHVKASETAEYVGGKDRPPGTVSDEWFHTGDIGHVSEDGLLVIKGRSSEILNRGGVIIAPDQIEKVVESNASVKEAAAFTKANARGIDEIWVAVVADRSFHAETVLHQCRGLLGDKAPDRFVVVDSLPRTENGKLKRGELKAQFGGG